MKRAKLDQRGRGRKPMKFRSPNMVVEQIERSAMIRQMEADGRSCEVCPLLAHVGIKTHCAHRIQGLHERRKSSSGGSRLNPANLIPACNWGNSALECIPAKVRELTRDRLVVRPGDDEWLELGARVWRKPV